MNRPELISECSRRFGKRAWLGASNDELQRCLDTSVIPDAWASGRPSASAAAMAGACSASNLPAGETSSADTGAMLPGLQQVNAAPARSDSLADVLAQALQGRITAGVDADQVKAIAREVFAEMGYAIPRRVEIHIPDRSAVNVGVQHCQFDEVLQTLLACGQVWIAGPAGSGKTTLAEACAKALGYRFYFNGAIDSPYKLAGFIDAQGRIIRPAFREAYEHGGVYLFDEVDASMPAAVLAFNAAMSNGKYDFPDGSVERHPNFYCIAAANTYGNGATDDYVGRMKQDAAFLDRFPSIYLDYDENLEHAIARNADWVNYVQACRRVARSKGLKIVISPRASVFGSKLLAAGMKRERVAELTIRKGISADHWRTIAEGVAA